MARATVATTTLYLGDLTIELTRKRVKNINLRVRRDGTVAVSAPPRVPQSAIEDFVTTRHDWILAAQGRLAQKRTIHEAHCTEGAEVVLWGTPLLCHIDGDATAGRPNGCSFSPSGTTLTVAATGSYAAATEEADVLRTRALMRWLRKLLVEQAESILPTCEATVGKQATRLRFRAMSSRWGSCNVRTGDITLNTELIHYPTSCLTYVLVHELCHLHEPSHNARFHALMDQFYPNWRSDRARLAGKEA